jgi:AcrR family transcriptional regulator
VAKKTRRDLVLAAAAELFAEHGYHGVGMRAIGDAVGIRGPSLYHYFPSKADLLSAITLASTTEFIDAHLPPFEHDPEVLGALRRMLRAHILYFREHRVEQKVSLRELSTLGAIDPVRHAEVQRGRRRYQRAIESRIAFGVSDGQIAAIDPRLAAFAILGLVNGINDWFRDSGPLTIEQVADQYCGFVVDRLLAPPGGTPADARVRRARGRAGGAARA